jgi:hypothetical protein
MNNTYNTTTIQRWAKNISENSDMPSLTVTSSAIELRSDCQNLVEKVEKSVSESRSNLTDR